MWLAGLGKAIRGESREEWYAGGHRLKATQRIGPAVGCMCNRMVAMPVGAKSLRSRVQQQKKDANTPVATFREGGNC